MFKKSIKVLGSLAAFAFVASTPSQAVTVFQSVPTFDTAQVAAWCSSCIGSYSAFDQFTLSSAETITGITFAAYNEDPYWPVDVTINIFDLAGAPLFSQTFTPLQMTGTVLDPSSNNVTFSTAVRTVAPSGLILGPGSYLISFYNPDDFAPVAYDGPNLGFVTDTFGSNDPNAPVIQRGFTLGFSLDADASPVPGPVVGAGLPGVLMALCGIIAYRRRKALIAA